MKTFRKTAFTLAEGATHVDICDNIRKCAFTLAEVLITLGIIGVVAAVTMPILVNNIKDRQYRAMWKKAYAEIGQVFTNAIGENDIDIHANQSSYAMQVYYHVFSRLTNDFCVKDSIYGHSCPNNNSAHIYNCHSLNGDKNAAYYSTWGGYAQLSNGMRIYAHGYLWTYPLLTVDVNGPKNSPNTVGRDIFLVSFKGNKIIPGGAPGHEHYGCDKRKASQTGYVGIAGFSGSGCAYKYLYE